MSRRVTRSSARLAAESGASNISTQARPPPPSTSISTTNRPSLSSRKRKARASSPAASSEETGLASARHGKRQKLGEVSQQSRPPSTRSTRRRSAQNETAMSNNGYAAKNKVQTDVTLMEVSTSAKYTEEPEKQLPTKSGSRRQSSRGIKTQQGMWQVQQWMFHVSDCLTRTVIPSSRISTSTTEETCKQEGAGC